MDYRLPPVIERYLEAYKRRDVDAMLATLTDDIEFEHISGGSTNVRVSGHKAFLDLARTSAGIFSSRSQTVTFTVRQDDHVAVMVSFLGTVASDMPNGWKSGQQVKLRGCSFFQLRANAICKIVDFS